MNAPAHVAEVSSSIRYVVIPQQGGYAVYRSTKHAAGGWWRCLAHGAGFSHGLGTAIRLAEDAAKREREAA